MSATYDALREAKEALFALEKREIELINQVARLEADSSHAQNRLNHISKDKAHRFAAIANAFGSATKVDRQVADDQHTVDEDNNALATAQASLDAVRANKAQIEERVNKLADIVPRDARMERERHEAGFGALEASRQAFARAEEDGQRALKDAIDASWAIGSTKDRKKAADLAIAKEDVLEATRFYERARMNLNLPPLAQAAELQAAFDSALKAAYSDGAVNARIQRDLVQVHYASSAILLEEQAEIPKLQAARAVAVM